jgi:radical SAM protein with 4Fe4S-binding SPASM domain
MGLKQFIRRLSPSSEVPLERAGIAPGLYHYQRDADGTYTRFHLRVDTGGSGLLLANATAAAWLAPSGVIIAKGVLDAESDDAIVERLTASFRNVTVDTVASDLQRVRRIIGDLAAPGDNYPLVNLSDPSFTPEAVRLGKPLSADVPLAAPKRLTPILDRLWYHGIPHVTIVAGEAPNPVHLVRAVERAEDIGLIAGVRGRAGDLTAGTLIKDLAMAGVDHINVLVLSAVAEVHDALAGSGDHEMVAPAFAQIRDSEVCPVAEVALVDATIETMEETFAWLEAASIRNIGCYAIAIAGDTASREALTENELLQAAQMIEETADELDVRYLWYPPIRFDTVRPLPVQVRRGPRCSGDHAVRVEPDGRVIPARGPFVSVGNLLSDEWSALRDHESYQAYRRRVETDTHCDQCPGLVTCAADCPRDPAGWVAGWDETEPP